MKHLMSIYCLTLSLIWQVNPGHSDSQVAPQQQTPPNQVEEIRRRQRQAALERESFKAGRELLRQKGVPFDPDALLDPQ